MPLHIEYESRGFSGPNALLKGNHTLTTSWDDLLWAAITVGRPNRQFVFQHGEASLYEAFFRLSLVKMSLEQSLGRKLKRTAAARTLDPTEKGAVNYFIGMTVCKLFADKLLGAPWMLHLDVFRPDLDVQLASRSRPDLIGQTLAGEWISLECKGRLSVPDKKSTQRAKHQATRIISVGGIAPTYCIGGFAFIKNETLRFEWDDPAPDREIRNPIRIQIRPDDWRRYYQPVLAMVRTAPAVLNQMMEEPTMIDIEAADVKVGIAPQVLQRLQQAKWEEALEAARDGVDDGYYKDGIALKAGPTWSERRFEEG